MFETEIGTKKIMKLFWCCVIVTMMLTESDGVDKEKTITQLLRRITKSTLNKPLPKYEPIEYDSVKVGQNKRQAVKSISTTTTTSTTTSPATLESESNNVDLKGSLVDAATADSTTSDTGPSIADLEDSFGGAAPVQPGDSELPPPRKNGFYWMLDWNSFLEVGDGDTKVNIHFEPKLGDPQMFIPVNVP